MFGHRRMHVRSRIGELNIMKETLLLVLRSVHGQDMAWPQFRGPESNPVGKHARLAEHWSKTENVEWSQEIPGRGWSSPIVTGGRVYVTTVYFTCPLCWS